MSTYEIDMTIKHVQNHWHVNVYRYERTRHEGNPATWNKPLITHVCHFNMPMVPTDQCWEDLTVRAALAVILRDMSGDHPDSAATALTGGSPDTTQPRGSTISQAPAPEGTARAKRAPLNLVRLEGEAARAHMEGE